MGWKDTITTASVAKNEPRSWRDTIQVATPSPQNEEQKGGLLNDLAASINSGARGFANMATLGFAPKIVGAMTSPIGAAKAIGTYVGYKPTEDDKDLAEYELAKQAYKNEDLKSEGEAPYSSLAGKLLGGVATAPAAGSGLVAKTVAQGALYGLGEGEAKGDLLEAAKNAGIGAGGSLAGLAAGSLLQKAIPEATKSAKYAEEKIIEHLRPTPKVARALGEDRLSDIAREALDSGAVKFGSKIKDTAANLSNSKKILGEQIGNILEESSGKINLSDLATNIQKNVISPLSEVATNSKVADAIADDTNNLIKSYVDRKLPEDLKKSFLAKAIAESAGDDRAATKLFYDMGAKAVDLSPKELELEKRAINKGINYFSDAKIAQEAKKSLARELKTATESAIDNPLFQGIKDKFGKTAEALSMAERTAGLTGGGSGLLGHLDDLTAGKMAFDALMHGHAAAGAGIEGARMLTKGKVASSLGVTADQASKLLQKYPWLNDVATGAETLATKGSPAFAREKIKGLLGK